MDYRQRSSWSFVIAIGIAVLVVGWYLFRPNPRDDDPNDLPPDDTSSNKAYLFCFWNVENLFDDQEDPKLEGVDRELDRWFANNPEVRRQKLDRLCDALLRLNGGRGPDIIAMVEVEGMRAAESLRQALNDRQPTGSRPYPYTVMKDTGGLRHISPAVVSRVPVETSRTRVLGRAQRILETHLTMEGHDLVVIVSHWTSRITDKDGAARGRYADQIYRAYREMYERNSRVDCLVCGDFNDTPDDESVTRRLHATGDRNAVVRSGMPPRLLNLLAHRDAETFGTHFHQNLVIYDQIAVSPGLLDRDGWTCDPDAVRVVNSLVRPHARERRPWRFGGPTQRSPRGYSDHFPVVLALRVMADVQGTRAGD